MKLSGLFSEFFNSEKAGGVILLIATVFSIVLANTTFQKEYLSVWSFMFEDHSITHWINDGLMTIFFLLIGLELEREIYNGELSDLKNASLPIFAAFGGMIVPSVFYTLFNYNLDTKSGFGIPMATDIAFAIGILSLLGKRVPFPLKVFLTALAVVDDLGAIIIIAAFYSAYISWINLSISLSIFGVLLILNRLKVHNLIPYLLGGLIMWYFMLHSGVHATITGVLLAFAIPFANGDEKSPSIILQHFLHKPVAFIVLPIFAMANTCITISDSWFSSLFQASSLGIFMGLVVGKPLGIWLFSYVSVKFKISKLPLYIKWSHILGAGFLGGIGFTMSIFITLLAFENATLIDSSKISIMLSSLIAGIIGYVFLKARLNK